MKAKWMSALALLVISNYAWAGSCSGTGRTTAWTPPSVIDVPRDAAEGSVIYSSGWVGVGVAMATCVGPLPLLLDRGFVSPGMTAAQFPYTYTTDVPGVGIKIGFSDGYSTSPSTIDAQTTISWPRKIVNVSIGNYSITQRFLIELVKIGPVSEGTLSVSPVRIYYHNMLTNELTTVPTLIRVRSTGCQVLTNPVNVKLPKVLNTAFSGVGSTAGSQSFNLLLTCDAGVKVSYRIDGDTTANDVLDNTATTAPATGVGIQLFQDSNIVQKLATTTYFGKASATQITLPLAAKYYQQNAQVTAGTVSANATVTFVYE